MSSIQKILYHVDTGKFEDNLGGFYDNIEDVIRNNQDKFEDIDIEYLIISWTERVPKRINFISPLEWEYDI
jgi:hypothetical protein